MQAALEGRLPDAGDFRGVARGQTLDVAKHDRGSPVGRQAVERLLEGPLELAVERLGLGAKLRRGRRGRDRVLAIRNRVDLRTRATA